MLQRTGDGHDIEAIFRVVQGDRINNVPGAVLGLASLELPPAAVAVPEMGQRKKALSSNIKAKAQLLLLCSALRSEYHLGIIRN